MKDSTNINATNSPVTPGAAAPALTRAPQASEQPPLRTIAPLLTPKKRVAQIVKPGGRTNRRVMLVLFCSGGVLIFLWMLLSGSAKPSSASSQSKPARRNAVPPVPVKPVGVFRDGGNVPDITDQTLAPPRQQLVFAGQETAIFRPAAPGQARVSTEIAPATPKKDSVFAVEAQAAFATPLRNVSKSNTAGKNDGTGTPLPTAGAADDEKSGLLSRLGKIPRGTQIQMLLVEPVASGIASFARVRVAEDVKGESGEVLIARGTEGVLPFAPEEFHGRLVLNPTEEGFLKIAGNEVPVRGSVKGNDGRPGIAGKVKTRGGPNPLRRVAGAVARSASGMAGAMGGIGGTSIYNAEQAIGGMGETGYGAIREVIVPASTRFVFVVGL